MQPHPSRIERGLWWDRAWSIIQGCTPTSIECLRCWSAAEAHMRSHRRNQKLRARYGGLTAANGAFNGTVRTDAASLDMPLKRRKPTVYAVWTDLFHEHVPRAFIHQAMARIGLAGQHEFMVLTKRAARMARYFEGAGPVSTWGDIAKDILGEPVRAMFPENLWLGVTVGHPKSLWRVAELLKCRAAKKFLSVEPLLAPLNLERIIVPDGHGWNAYCNPLTGFRAHKQGGWDDPAWKLDWLIIGCESGHRRRPCKLGWVESLIHQADAAGIPVFVKQLDIDGRVSKNPADWPEWARRREFPG